MYVYETCCVAASGDDINQMRWEDPAKVEVTYRTMRRHCPDLLRWAKSVGYDRDLPLSKDWHVSYYRSFYRGRPCYYLVWSGIEHIWVKQEGV